MLILIGGEKGGTGKTTLATNIAAMRTIRKKDVLLVDADRQESASSWCYIREEEKILPRVSSILKFGSGIRSELQELSQKYSDIIIDVGGRDSVELRSSLLAVDLAVLPIRSTQFDLWTMVRLNKLVEEVKQVNAKLKVFAVINAASTNLGVKETEEAVEFMNNFSQIDIFKTIVKERLSFHKAAADGKCVEELKPCDNKALREMKDLYEEIFNEI